MQHHKKTAIIVFIILSIFLSIPWLVYTYRKYGYLSFWSSIVAIFLLDLFFEVIFKVVGMLVVFVIVPIYGTEKQSVQTL